VSGTAKENEMSTPVFTVLLVFDLRTTVVGVATSEDAANKLIEAEAQGLAAQTGVALPITWITTEDGNHGAQCMDLGDESYWEVISTNLYNDEDVAS
jgi:hypothetical protein